MKRRCIRKMRHKERIRRRDITSKKASDGLKHAVRVNVYFNALKSSAVTSDLCCDL